MATATSAIDSLTAPACQDARLATVRSSSYFRWKSLVDRLLALVLLIPGLPIMTFIWLALRCASPGPALFRQTRVGQNGRNFVMIKFRTMVVDAEAKTGAVWAAPNDPRRTRIGRILRRLHLDELPQIWNVLRGEMSLVGPRPERPEFVRVLAQEIPGYMNRLVVVPGVTGLAQVNLPPDTDLDSVRSKLALDLEYISNARLGLDLRLVLYSGLRLFGVPGWILIRVLRLGRQVPLSTGTGNTLGAAPKLLQATTHESPVVFPDRPIVEEPARV